MAHVRIRAGDSEVEIDSRDFYVDNETVHSVMKGLSKCLPPRRVPGRSAGGGNSAGTRAGAPRREDPVAVQQQQQQQRVQDYSGHPDTSVLGHIRDAEIFEPEFSDCDNSGGPLIAGAPDPGPRPLRDELLELLEGHGFFDSPRTASDAVQRLRQSGCSASSLAVSKILVEMSIGKKVRRHSSKGSAGTYVSASPPLASAPEPGCDGPCTDGRPESLVAVTAAV